MAFVGISQVDSFAATVALAALAGVGTGLFTPAALAGLPSLVERRQLPVANSVYGITADLGFTIGPALAAAALLFATAEQVTLVNGLTFGISALLLTRINFGAVVPDPTGSRKGLMREARVGLSEVRRIGGAHAIIIVSSATLFFGGLFNAGELPFVEEELDLGGSSYGALVAVFGVGFMLGSLSGSRGGSLDRLRRRFLVGVLLTGAGTTLAGLVPVLPAAVVGFTLAGLGNGMFLVHERLILQQIVPDQFLARAFGSRTRWRPGASASPSSWPALWAHCSGHGGS